METTQSVMVDPQATLTKDQINGIVGSAKNYRDKVLILTLAMTGRRVSEIIRSLKPEDIDWDSGVINFKVLKRRKPTRMLVYVHPKIRKILKDYIRRRHIRPEQYVFRICRQRADQIIKRAAKEAGIEYIGSKSRKGKRGSKVHAHTFRHSYAKMFAKNIRTPEGLVKLKDSLGHARLETTMFYLHFNPTEQKGIVDDMWKGEESLL